MGRDPDAWTLSNPLQLVLWMFRSVYEDHATFKKTGKHWNRFVSCQNTGKLNQKVNDKKSKSSWWFEAFPKISVKSGGKQQQNRTSQPQQDA